MKVIFPPELDELKACKQWVCATLAPLPNGKLNKVPMNPATGKAADTTDPATWADYDTACKAVEAGRYGCMGFVFAGGYMGIDLDHVIDPDTGEIHPAALEVMEAFDSYTEISPSGTGLHILIKIDTTEGIYTGKRNPDSPIDIEMYTGERYFTVTGSNFEDKPIAERTQAARELSARYIRKPERPATPLPAPARPAGAYSERRSNSELWRKMFASAKGAEIEALFNGDLTAHGGDHSRADQAFVNHLCYWTNGDPARIDELFRESRLYATEKVEAGINKWDKRHGGMTYGDKTIQKALTGFRPYTGPQRPQQGQQRPPAAPAGPAAPAADDKPQRPQQAPQRPRTAPDSVYSYIHGAMGDDLERFQRFKDRKTGYDNIDRIQSLYPGLYVLGAISSLGKTTFIHQMADQIAATGDHVLYFSLEQSRLEMVTKGISRMTARQAPQGDLKSAVSAIDIRGGKITGAVREAARAYAEAAKTESIIECGFDTTIDAITDKVTGYVREWNVKPVVIVDYLQIIRPADPRQTAKDAVDTHVRALKKLQVENDLVIIVICSLNRQNYLTPVDFESFKESGGIEYTADVVWGLQLAVMNDDLFSKEKSLKEKREKVRLAKLENPRRIQFICLKNRYGRSSYECNFAYYSQFDLFVPSVDVTFTEVTDPDNPFEGMQVSSTAL